MLAGVFLGTSSCACYYLFPLTWNCWLIDVQHLHKNLLQNFAQKRNLSRPMYSCESEGPPHASRFRCKVTINEKSYESLEFFPTIKEAEHAAARIALSCLSPGAIEEVQLKINGAFLPLLIYCRLGYS